MLSRKLVGFWFVAVLTVWLLAAVVDDFIPRVGKNDVHRSPTEVLSAWDGSHYAIIASNGYSTDGAERRRFAFFPMLPAIARLLGGKYYAVFAGILFNQLCFLGCIFLLNFIALGNKLSDPPLRSQPGFWLLVSPLSFFFLIFYTESLFLFLTLLMIVACRKEYFKSAFVLGIMLGLTRPTSICLPVLFLWWAVQNFRQGKSYLKLLLCAVSPWIGIGIYLGIVSYLVEDPFAYQHIQNQWWESRSAIPFISLINDFKYFLISLVYGQSFPLDIIARLFSSFCVLALIIWGWRKCDSALIVYVIVSMLFIHSQEPHRSTDRYELVLFPIYFLIPQAMINRPQLTTIISVSLVIIQILLFVRHISGGWVA